MFIYLFPLNIDNYMDGGTLLMYIKLDHFEVQFVNDYYDV